MLSKHDCMSILVTGLSMIFSAFPGTAALPLAEYNLRAAPIPTSWRQGMFAGNGNLGVMVYADPSKERLILELGCAEIIDSRAGQDKSGGVLFESPRLEIGKFYFKAPDIGKHSEIILSLADAEITGKVGSVPFRIFVSADPAVIVVETSLEMEEFNPAAAVSPRITAGKAAPKNYRSNPPPQLGTQCCSQELLSGRVFRTFWHRTDKAYLLSCGYDKTAESAVNKAKNIPFATLAESNRAAYRKFYEQSSLSVPDPVLEQFYWINVYKCFAATRPENLFPLDTMGPWSKTTAWPAIWWNLNTQLTYYWLLTANRLDQFEPLLRTFHDRLPVFFENAAEEFPGGAGIARATSYDCRGKIEKEKGNLPWVCHVLYSAYRYSGRSDTLEILRPLLRGCLVVYEKILKMESDGKYHLEKTHSPEYGDTRDCNYDLALLRWTAQTYLELSQSDPKCAEECVKWRNILTRLTDYPVDEATGYLIGADLALTSSHRHYSHLFMVYPLELGYDKTVAKKSIDHWLSMPQKHAGYTYTGAAAMAARIGNGDEAAKQLHNLLKLMNRWKISNTMYCEGENPVIETPFSFNAALQDMLLLSTPLSIRLFPAIPSKWGRASFQNFRTDGAFLVDARYDRSSGITYRIRAEHGGKVELLSPDGQSRKLTLSKGESISGEFRFHGNR